MLDLDPNVDIQQKYLNRFQDLQTDLENKSNENARLRYDFQFLKSEYAHAKEDFERKLFEQQQQYKTSLESLATERQELIVAKDVALTAAKKDVTKGRSEIQFSVQRIADLQEEIKTLVRDKTQLLEDYQSSQRTHKHLEGSRNEETRKLELNNQSLESQLQATKQDLEKCRANLVIAQEKISVEIRRSDDYESELRKTNNDFTAKNRDLEKAVKRERQHNDDLTRSYSEKIKAMEALLEAANAQRNEQRKIASEIEHKANKSIEQIKSKFQYEVNQITSDRDQFAADLQLSNDKLEMLESQKKEERKDFENTINDLNEEVAQLSTELNKSKEINQTLRIKVDSVAELEAQLTATKLQIVEITKIYETFKNDAELREKKLTNERNEAVSDKVDAIKALSNERADITRNNQILEENYNRKHLKMMEDYHALEAKLSEEKSQLSEATSTARRLKTREQKIKSTVTHKLEGYRKRLKKYQSLLDEQSIELAKIKRINGVPLEQHQRLEHELRTIKNKAKDLQHASSMWHLKMMGHPPPPLPGPSLMTQMALNKIRSDQNDINHAVRNLANTYHLDTIRSSPQMMARFASPQRTHSNSFEREIEQFRLDRLPVQKFDSLTNYQVDGFTRSRSSHKHGHRQEQHNRKSKSQPRPRKLSIKDKSEISITTSEVTQVIESTTVIDNPDQRANLSGDLERDEGLAGIHEKFSESSENDEEHIRNLEELIETQQSRQGLDGVGFEEESGTSKSDMSVGNSDFEEIPEIVETQSQLRSGLLGTTEETSKILNELMDDSSSELTAHQSNPDDTQDLSLISTASIESASLDEI